MEQGMLPEDPLQNIGGSRYLRLSKECRKEGYLIRFMDKPKLILNENFAKRHEYNWPVEVWEPPSTLSEERILVESGKNFCTCLSKASKGEYVGNLFHISWRIDHISGGRTMKVFSIVKVDGDKLGSFFQGPSPN